MANQPSLKFTFNVLKQGVAHNWSTKFHFGPGFPDTSTKWHTLWEAIWADLQPGLATNVFLLRIDGYEEDETKPVVAAYTDVLGGSDHGTFAAEGNRAPSIITALLRWTTDQKDSRGHAIGLRNFIHGVYLEDDADPDLLHTDQKAALQVVAATFDDAGAGYSDGVTTYKRRGPNGAVGLVGTCSPWVTRRVLARRG